MADRSGLPLNMPLGKPVGTITSIVAGTGLTGGTVTSSGTLAVDIGVTVQGYDADLAALAAISFVQGDVIYHNGTSLARLPAGTSGQFLKTNGAGANPAWAAGGGSAPTLTVFTATGANTWTKPAGLSAVVVEIVGGGGGGGGAAGVSGGVLASGGGGGGYSRKRIAAGTLGSTETATVGAGGAGGSTSGTNGTTGGTSSFGAHCSATGGTGGNGIIATAANTAGVAGGSGSGGDVNTTGGGSLWTGDGSANYSTAPGNGGDSHLGFGGQRSSMTISNGVAGNNYGGGGSGATGGGTGGKTGGAGAPGIILVWEFY